MLVRVKGKGVKLNGKWCYKNDETIIDEIEYKENKEFLDIIEDEETEQLPQIPNENDKDDEEIELQQLKSKAKELGIKNAHLMKKETLEELIAEKEAPMFGQRPDSNNGKPDSNIEKDNENSNTNENDKDNPQE